MCGWISRGTAQRLSHSYSWTNRRRYSTVLVHRQLPLLFRTILLKFERPKAQCEKILGLHASQGRRPETKQGHRPRQLEQAVRRTMFAETLHLVILGNATAGPFSPRYLLRSKTSADCLWQVWTWNICSSSRTEDPVHSHP